MRSLRPQALSQAVANDLVRLVRHRLDDLRHRRHRVDQARVLSEEQCRIVDVTGPARLGNFGRDLEGPVVGVTPEGMDMKFRDCASRTLPSASVNEALELLHNLEKQPDISSLMRAVRGA